MQKSSKRIKQNSKNKTNTNTPQIKLFDWKRFQLKIVLLYLLLFVITLTAFYGVKDNSFLNMDDDVYVTDNSRVKQGINWDNIKWSFSTIYFGFYYPLTWLSHMLDCELYGLNAGGHHITSVIIHILNTLLLFFALYRMTRKEWRSFIVAGLFAVHPLHVESVAWISERKDVLSAFFFFLGLLFYSYYVEKPTIKRYIPVAISYALGLMSKPMVITFPFVLLLLDYWPLERVRIFEDGKGKKEGLEKKWGEAKKLIYEKIPLFVLIPIFSFLTFYAQKEAQAVVPVSSYGLIKRIANAAISYFSYLRKMVFPNDLVAYYPIKRGEIPLALLFISLLVLLLLTLFAVFIGKKKKYFLSGVLWFLGMLIPVIGIVRVGDQAMADRYTYIPLAGIFFAIVWLLGDMTEGRANWQKILALLTAVIFLILIFVTRFYVSLWKNEETLFKWAISKTEDNWFAHNNLGSYLVHKGKIEEAAFHINEALKINPYIANAHINVGYYLAEKGRYEEAIEHYRSAVELDPKSVKGWNNLGLALSKSGKLDEAIECFLKTKELDPSFVDSYINLGYTLTLKGNLKEAAEEYKQAVKIAPQTPSALNELGATLMDSGKFDESIEYFKEAIKLSPDFIEPRINMALVLKQIGKLDEAEEEYKDILKIKPDMVNVINDLGLLLMQKGKNLEAEEKFKQAIKISANYENSYINMGVLFANERKYKEAADYFRKALEINPNSEIARANLERAERLLFKEE